MYVLLTVVTKSYKTTDYLSTVYKILQNIKGSVTVHCNLFLAFLAASSSSPSCRRHHVNLYVRLLRKVVSWALTEKQSGYHNQNHYNQLPRS